MRVAPFIAVATLLPATALAGWPFGAPKVDYEKYAEEQKKAMEELQKQSQSQTVDVYRAQLGGYCSTQTSLLSAACAKPAATEDDLAVLQLRSEYVQQACIPAPAESCAKPILAAAQAADPKRDARRAAAAPTVAALQTDPEYASLRNDVLDWIGYANEACYGQYPDATTCSSDQRHIEEARLYLGSFLKSSGIHSADWIALGLMPESYEVTLLRHQVAGATEMRRVVDAAGSAP